ncbi:MAG: hypothetical protein ACRBFS_25920 [Aureispira sp.]
MRQLFLFSILLSLPFLSKGQDAATLQYLQSMGYEQVDLKAMRQQQTAAPCATCPYKKAAPNVTRVPMTATEELQNLKGHLPRLQQAVADSQADPTVSRAIRQKHQTALDRTVKRIQELEQTPPPTSIIR